MLSLKSKFSGKLSYRIAGFHTSNNSFEAKKLTVREAIREAIADEIVRDEKVFLMGEVTTYLLVNLFSLSLLSHEPGSCTVSGRLQDLEGIVRQIRSRSRDRYTYY
jgi:hypothetical protein